MHFLPRKTGRHSIIGNTALRRFNNIPSSNRQKTNFRKNLFYYFFKPNHHIGNMPYMPVYGISCIEFDLEQVYPKCRGMPSDHVRKMTTLRVENNIMGTIRDINGTMTTVFERPYKILGLRYEVASISQFVCLMIFKLTNRILSSFNSVRP